MMTGHSRANSAVNKSAAAKGTAPRASSGAAAAEREGTREVALASLAAADGFVLVMVRHGAPATVAYLPPTADDAMIESVRGGMRDAYSALTEAMSESQVRGAASDNDGHAITHAVERATVRV